MKCLHRTRMETRGVSTSEIGPHEEVTMIRGRTLVLALVAVLLARWAEVGAQSEDHRSARIIARTAPLFRAVLPPDVFLQLQAEPFDTRYGEVWDVTCRDAEGRLLAELNWGTRRRCLLDISTFVIDGRRTDEAAARLAADVVANRSLDWVSALDRSAHRDRWQSPRAPLPNRAIWSTGRPTAGPNMTESM